jgi:hypothetical protein
MNKAKKAIIIFFCGLFIASLCFNFYFAFNALIDNAIVKIDNNTILTKNELSHSLISAYKVTFVNEVVSEKLLELEVQDRGITVPTKEQMYELSVTFPAFASYSADSEKGARALSEAHYIYEMLKQNGLETSKLQDFLLKRYGDRNCPIYEVAIYETDDHSFATDIENSLRSGVNLNDIENNKGIQFSENYVVSMDTLLSEDGNNSMSPHDVSSQDAQYTTYTVGDVFHISGDGQMEIIQIKRILDMEYDYNYYLNLYFSQNYTGIKNEIINGLKGKHIVTYY